jgi:hypothetical protein
MPRKVDPHRYEQTHVGPTDFVKSFELPGDVEKFLPEGLSLEQKNLALENIRYAFGEYRWEQKVGPHMYSRGEAAKALRDLLAAGDFRRPALAALNQRAYDLLYDLTPDRDATRWMLGFDESAPPEHALREGADRALNMLNTIKGPEKSVALNVLVTRLCHVYEEATGKTITHHSKTNDLAYSQKAQSVAGKFVTRVINAAFADVSATMINRQLRAFVKYRPMPF